MIFDRKLSRLGMAQKRSQTCRSSPQSENLASIHGNNILRLVFGIVYLLISLVIASKVTAGCLQFFDISLLAFCKKKFSRNGGGGNNNQSDMNEEPM